MKVIITFTFCCDNLQKSKFMTLEKPGKAKHRKFFLLFSGHPVPVCETLPLWYDRSRRSAWYNAEQIVPTANNATSMSFYQFLQWNGHLLLHSARIIDMTRYVVQLNTAHHSLAMLKNAYLLLN